MNKVFLLIILIWAALSTARASDLPGEELRLKIFDKIVSELERIDGEGLPARKNRPENWKATLKILKELARQAKTPVDFGQVFRKLDATYPNLHAQIVLNEKFDIAPNRLRVKFGVRFGAEVVDRNQKNFTYKVSSVDTEMVKSFKEVTRPAIGDEILAINGRPIKDWARESFIYCKFPLREQCEMNFFDHFRKGFLSWDWRSPLEYTLQRNGRTWKIQVPVEIPSHEKAQAPQSSKLASEEEKSCPNSDRYLDFQPKYRGLNICAFESEKHPKTTVLSIQNFRYRDLSETSKIQSIKDEVTEFFANYWGNKARVTEKLIIDLIDNGGGDTPILWYTLFYDKPFQEQFVQFKKIKELEDEKIRNDLFYEGEGKEIRFSELRRNGTYPKIRDGAFLPPVPQFCAKEGQSCAKGLFEPYPHKFKGKVKILVNEWCISTCTGFVWSMREQLGKRVKIFGVPDSGDSAYARLFMDLYLDSSQPEGFRLEISPRPGRTNQKLPENAVFRWQITATRSTDSRGNVISAKPTPVDVWIPQRYRHFDDPWETKVFQAALRH